MAEKVPEEALGQTWAFGAGVLEKLKPRLGQEVGLRLGTEYGSSVPGQREWCECGGEQERHRSSISLHQVTLLQPQQRMWMPLAL